MPDYELITRISSGNHSGRRPGPVRSITIHWWNSPGHYGDSQTDGDAESVARYLSRSGGTSSANDVISGKRVFNIVDPKNIAWHAGVWARNLDSYGIEVDPDAPNQPDTYETVAARVRDLRKVFGNVPLRRHRDWKNTACPGNLDVELIDRLSRAEGTSKPSKPGMRTVKLGSSGVAVKVLQEELGGLKVDGKFGQKTKAKVVSFQKAHKLTPDGIVGPLTWKALGR